MGFRSIPWNSTPADASAPPTSAEAMTRGSLIWNRMVSALDGQVGEKWESPILFRVIFSILSIEIGTAPIETAMSMHRSNIAPSATRISSRRFCFSLVDNKNPLIAYTVNWRYGLYAPSTPEYYSERSSYLYSNNSGWIILASSSSPSKMRGPARETRSTFIGYIDSL